MKQIEDKIEEILSKIYHIENEIARIKKLIYSLSQSVADRLGGGASVNSDGTVNAPLYEVGTGIYNNVGSALSALNTSMKQIEDKIEEILSKIYHIENEIARIKKLI
uniref:GENERAL CONTROL PROTEIN GCN4, PUTATIVE INNER MEMBRANE PROTEIN n=1 Tax=Salmonella typhimurium TaxID=90371 RepID=UPI0002A11572|nr:Chain A, GENERAL CONTROL PROTEIN GCN4, PUTATIVE INNER MEMBRANE PROTEIN [synthetic construct]2YNY_B Chain B, GENERAL CONTROL PROTEIN GCN4, PUTATIVE INNER MEMBRANE PROTEIN [synthetic construct]2YNY_C Chain C, GENERAL CONTROL PROTEIN GCN4, PUTATIVE INNER MEMBRANE PROTEIN [synthetic construct]